jgi:hypothetical protein
MLGSFAVLWKEIDDWVGIIKLRIHPFCPSVSRVVQPSVEENTFILGISVSYL